MVIPHIALHRCPGQTDPGILRGAGLRKLRILLLKPAVKEFPRQITSARDSLFSRGDAGVAASGRGRSDAAGIVRAVFHMIEDDTVSHAEGSFVGKRLRTDPEPVQSTRHNAEAPVAALRRAVQKLRRIVQKRAEVRSAHVPHDPLIVDRPVLIQTVGSLRQQFVGKVAAAHEEHPPAGLVDALLDELPQAVVLRQGKAGEAYADQFVICIFLIDEPQRDERGVVQLCLPLAEGPRREVHGVGIPADHIPELRIIGHLQLRARGAETAHIAGRAFPRGNMEPVAVQDHMGRRNDDGLRLRLRDELRRPLIGAVRRGDLLLFPSPDLRKNDRGMRNHTCTDNTHGVLLF